MAEPFLAEIRIMSFNFPPKGWAMCNGQALPINQNQPLFSLLGTVFGGNGQTTFQLPDLRGQVPIHFGANYKLGQPGGEPAHTVVMAEMPMHTHVLQATNNIGTDANPIGTVVLAKSVANSYGAASNLVPMNNTMVGNTGGGQPHENRQPYLALTFCIALQGIFPSKN